MKRLIIQGVVYAAALITSQCAGAALRVTHVGCPEISVASLDRAVAFYTGTLEFSLAKTDDSSRLARLAPGVPPAIQARTSRLVLGEECLDLTEYRSPRGAPFPEDSRANDGWFEHIAIVVTDMDKAYARVRGSGTVLCRTSRKPFPSRTKKQRALWRSTFAIPTDIISS